MVVKKKLWNHMLVTSVLLLIFVFVGGLLLGRFLASLESNQVTEFLRENELDTESYLIEQELLKTLAQDNCELSSLRISDISSELAKIGTKLASDDAKQSLGADNYVFLKKKFHLMQIKTFIMFKRVIDKCHANHTVILYYYSLDDSDSAAQGFVLDKVVADHGVHVFAIEYDYSGELSFLETYYDVTSTPTIIIDYHSFHQGLTDYDTIVREIR